MRRQCSQHSSIGNRKSEIGNPLNGREPRAASRELQDAEGSALVARGSKLRAGAALCAAFFLLNWQSAIGIRQWCSGADLSPKAAPQTPAPAGRAPEALPPNSPEHEKLLERLRQDVQAAEAKSLQTSLVLTDTLVKLDGAKTDLAAKRQRGADPSALQEAEAAFAGLQSKHAAAKAAFEDAQAEVDRARQNLRRAEGGLAPASNAPAERAPDAPARAAQGPAPAARDDPWAPARSIIKDLRLACRSNVLCLPLLVGSGLTLLLAVLSLVLASRARRQRTRALQDAALFRARGLRADQQLANLNNLIRDAQVETQRTKDQALKAVDRARKLEGALRLVFTDLKAGPETADAAAQRLRDTYAEAATLRERSRRLEEDLKKKTQELEDQLQKKGEEIDEAARTDRAALEEQLQKKTQELEEVSRREQALLTAQSKALEDAQQLAGADNAQAVQAHLTAERAKYEQLIAQKTGEVEAAQEKLRAAEAQWAQERETLAQQHAEEADALRRQHAELVGALGQQHATEVETLCSQHEEETQRIRARLERWLARLAPPAPAPVAAEPAGPPELPAEAKGA